MEDIAIFVDMPLHFIVPLTKTSLVAQMVKRLSIMWETRVRSLGWEDTLGKGKATHSSILAWRTPWGRKESGMTE